MLVKDYQLRALQCVSEWARKLREERGRIDRDIADMEKGGASDSAIHAVRTQDYPMRVWQDLGKRGFLPQFKDGRGIPIARPHVARTDSLHNPIPHACLKIPTGGGKTFLGVSALAHLDAAPGLVLWIVPSLAIYDQTRAAFKNRDHPYRAALSLVAGKQFKLLKKESPFSRKDVENNLCVMPLMLQAAARKIDRDFLRMFRDSGSYPSFFSAMDGASGGVDFMKKHSDLETYGLAEGGAPGTVKQSLLNVFKIVRPVIVLDEAQNAYPEERRRQLCKFNPKFILELSATPTPGVSNTLVDITGETLRGEQMIKLPLNVSSPRNTDWKNTLARVKQKRDELEAAAEKFREKGGRYIRPIALIRVERTGKDQRGGGHIHAEDAREYLSAQLGVPLSHIRQKTAEINEIANENLLSAYSEVRYILTKSALQEGWDCAFAYVLALLDSTTNLRALTQMTGRILRQPGAEWTGVPALDQAYVFCCNRDVGDAAAKVKAGLELAGLGDLGGYVVAKKREDDAIGDLRVTTAKRRRQFTNLRVVLPRVLHRRKGKLIPLDYDEDILREVPWADISRRPLNLTLTQLGHAPDPVVVVDLPKREVSEIQDNDATTAAKPLTLEFFVRYLSDVISNPFVAARIVRTTLDSLREAAGGNDGLYDRRYTIAEEMKQRLAKTVESEARAVFCRKLERKEIRLQLTVDSGHELPVSETKPGGNEPVFQVRSHVAEKSLLEPMLLREFNSSERNFAGHLEGLEAVEWWHRFAAHRGYALQGWRRHRVYPDFVVCISEGRGRNRRVLILETKGMHLSGNEDTEYKEELLRKLSAKNPRALECGDFTLKTGGREVRMVLRVLLHDSWQKTFDELATGK